MSGGALPASSSMANIHFAAGRVLVAQNHQEHETMERLALAAGGKQQHKRETMLHNDT